MGFPGAATDDDAFVDDCDCNLPGPEVVVKGGGKGIGPKPIGGKLGGAGIELLPPMLKAPGGGGGGGPEYKSC